MDNDDKINENEFENREITSGKIEERRNEERKSEAENRNEIHQDVLLFLGDELNNIHKSSQGQIYNIEEEYAKTKKHKKPFVFFVLLACFAVVGGISFLVHQIVSAKNEEIEVSLENFDDLNLKSLLNTVSSAQNNYDNAVKSKSSIEVNMESRLKSAKETYDNDVFLLDSMKLSKTDYNKKLEEIKNQYDLNVVEIHKEFDESISQAEKQIQEYKKQLAEFDTAKIEAAREQEKALNSERQLRQLETQKLTKKYEEQIKQINNSMNEMREKNKEEMRRTVTELSENHQKEINALIDEYDPVLEDDSAASIIELSKDYDLQDFDGNNAVYQKGIDSVKVKDAVANYQQIYDDYGYLESKISSIPQKNSIPQYVEASKNLVNAMGDSFLNVTMSFYDETQRLNGEIRNLNQDINKKNGEIKKINEDFEIEREGFRNDLQKQKSEYEETLVYLMGIQKTNAIVLKIDQIPVQKKVEFSEQEIEDEIQSRMNAKMAEYEELRHLKIQEFEAKKEAEQKLKEMEKIERLENQENFENQEQNQNDFFETDFADNLKEPIGENDTENSEKISNENPLKNSAENEKNPENAGERENIATNANQNQNQNANESEKSFATEIEKDVDFETELQQKNESSFADKKDEENDENWNPTDEELGLPSKEEILEKIRSEVPKSRILTEKINRINIYVAPKARYLIDEKGEDGADAEIRLSKPVKGKIFRDKTNESEFYFEVSPDKNGVLPEIDYAELQKGISVKILGK